MTDPLRPNRLGRALRSTPLRQALMLTALFAVINVAALGASYAKMRQDRLQELQTHLTREADELEVSATPRAMAAIVAAKAEAADPRETVIVFLARDGRQTGNARALRVGERLHLETLGHEPLDQTYIREIRRLDSGTIILAASLAPVEALRRTFGELLLLTLGPTVLLSLLLGAAMARRTARRVADIETMLSHLTEGNLTARLPLTARKHSDDDLDRIGQRLNLMAARQQDTVEALKQVSSDIAHDLRTPLQRLSLHLEALEAALPADSPALPHAEALRQENQRATAIFSGLLQIARIEGGTDAETARPVDLGKLAQQVQELYEIVAEDNGQSLTYSPPPTPVEKPGHPDLLMQAMVNLVENAVRHAGPGAKIAIAVTPQGFSVTDTGPGIPTEARGKVTRRLYRLEHSRSTPGNGLGLALVTAIARAHGARLEIGDTLADNPDEAGASTGLRVDFSF